MQARVWYAALFLSTAIALPVSAQTTGTIAFTNVNVVPMDTERILTRQTVIVVDGRVSLVGRSEQVSIPAGARTIEGGGGFLMPGLADLHVHVRNEEDLVVYVANGVTTLLDMGGPPIRLDWRDRIAVGDLFGPRLFASFFIDGGGGRAGLVETVEEAREAIRGAAESGYDYIKAYNSLTTAQFDAIVEEANRAGLSIIGHGVRDPGLEHILESGMSMVAHGEEYIYTFFRGCNARDRIPEAIELTRRTGAYVLPNLSAYEIMTLQWGKPPVVDSLLNLPERRFLHPNFQRSWAGWTIHRAKREPGALFRLPPRPDESVRGRRDSAPAGDRFPGNPGYVPGLLDPQRSQKHGRGRIDALPGPSSPGRVTRVCFSRPPTKIRG